MPGKEQPDKVCAFPEGTKVYGLIFPALQFSSLSTTILP